MAKYYLIYLIDLNMVIYFLNHNAPVPGGWYFVVSVKIFSVVSILAVVDSNVVNLSVAPTPTIRTMI